MRSALPLLLFVGLSHFFGRAEAQPSVSVKYAFYSLDGQSAHDIETQVAEGGNLDHLDGVLPGSTWLVRWKYDFEEKNKLCKLVGVTTKVEISRSRPVWKKADHLGIEQRKPWDDYLVHLDINDDAQQEVVLAAANEIENKISTLPPQKSCKQLGAAANLIGQGVLAKYRGLEVSADVKNRIAAVSKRNQ